MIITHIREKNGFFIIRLNKEYSKDYLGLAS